MCFSFLSVYILSLKFSPFSVRATFRCLCVCVCVCVCVYRIYLSVSESHSVMSDSLQPHGLYVACQALLSMEFSRQED